MNVDAGDSVFDSHICFNALATLQNIKNVENSCNFCSLSDHSTYMCPVLSQGEHVKDTSVENLSRSSVPHGLQVYENDYGTHIISVQKFAKGCRFGPLLAPKSYIPIENTKFPLTIFGTVNLDMDAMHMPELKDLFKVRNIYLDTRNEKYCNWMIHVDPARYANEQNLIAYEEDNEIFFAAIEDLDVGDMLKVWYSPKYGQCMKMASLCESTHAISNNVLSMYCESASGVILPSEIQLFNNIVAYDDSNNQPSRTEILLPSIKNIIKPSSYVCYESRRSYNTLLPYYPTDNVVSLFPATIEPTNGSDESLQLDSNTILNLDASPFISTAHIRDDSFIGYEDDDCEQNAAESLNVSNGRAEPIDASITCSNSQQQNGATDKPDDKKMYPCQLCDKKYSTMTNIYRHVRTLHNFFLCSLCMNMFKLETELKEHIHKCPKSDVKKPQCSVCMQYFSNSWSLTRHIKIHVSAGECDADILMEKKAKEKKPKYEGKDSIDLSDIEKNSQDSFVNDLISLAPEPSLVPSISLLPALCEIVLNTDPTVTVSAPSSAHIEKFEHGASADSSGNDNDNEISVCIVCEKRFKSKSCLNKHLRSVHTVKVLTGVKRSITHNSHSKSHSSSAKRSQSSDGSSTITHTGSPVNPYTAKALASKLNERNNLINGSAKKLTSKNILFSGKPMSTANVAKTALNDIPVPPLISIQVPSATSNRLIDVENGQQQNRSSFAITNREKSKFSSMQRKNSTDFESDLYVPTFNIFKSPTHENGAGKDMTAAKARSQNGGSSGDEMKLAIKNTFLVTEKLHKCDLCCKKFNKKYELKRHRAVHEYSTYTCPYCAKVVKRKPSIIKHLRLSHKGSEHIWSNSGAIENLRQNKGTFENSQKQFGIQNSSKSGKATAVNNIQPVVALKTDAGNVGSVTNNSDSSTNANKSKKSTVVINYLKRLNLNNMKKYLKKNPTDKPIEQFKVSLNTLNQTQTATVIGAPDASDNLNHDDNYRITPVDNHNHNHNFSSSSCNSEIYKNTVLLNSSNNSFTNSSNDDNTTSVGVNFDSNTPPLTPNTIIQSMSAPTLKIHNDLLYNKSLDKCTVAMTLDSSIAQKTLNAVSSMLPYRPTGDDVNVNNIIDNNCFFVDDDLNCNVVLHSPFSSDNDVDGCFSMANSNEECTMNKELLNKFHDRLDEMEEKIDSTDFKALWNEMLDEDNLNDVVDDMRADENDVEATIDDTADVDSIDDTSNNNTDYTDPITALK